VVDGWATAMLKLVVDSSAVKRQTEEGLKSADGTAAGRRAGQQYGKGFGDTSGAALRDAHGKFITDSARAGDQAGQAAGRSFASSFSRLTGGLFSGRGGPGGLARGTAGGAGPGILGISALRASIIGGGAAGLGALPALAAAGAVPGLAGLGLGTTASLFGQVAAPATDLVTAQGKAQDAAAKAVNPTQRKAAQVQQQAVNQQVAALTPAQRSMFNTISKLQDMWEKFTTGFAPLFAKAIAPVPRLFAQVLPALQQFFRGATTLLAPLLAGLAGLARQVLPLLGQAFRAVAPLMAPLLAGLTGLLTGLLPGLIALLHEAGPAVEVLGGFLSQLGVSVGDMFALFAPVVGASAVILKALLGVVSSLLPIIGSLAATMARELAPAFGAFAQVIQSLLPFLTIAGRLVAGLASAVLGDLSAALGAVAALLRGIAPALNGFVRALSGVFTVLENSGVFAVLGNALEALAGPLGRLVSVILRGLTPLLPPLIGFFSQLAALLASRLAAAIGALVPPLTQLATVALASLAQMLPVLLPLLTTLTSIFTVAVVAAIRAVAVALSAIVTAIPPGALTVIASGVLAVWAAFKVWAGIQAIIGGVTAAAGRLSLSMIRLGVQVAIAAAKAVAGWIAASATIVASFVAQAAAAAAAFIAENAATLGIIAGITLLVAAIVYLATHWRQVWSDVRNWARDAWQFLTHGWGQFLIPGLTAIRLAVEFVRDHWRAAWAVMRQIGQDFYRWLWTDFGAKLGSFFTRTIPGWLGSALASMRQWWRDVAAAFTSGWNTVWRNTITPMANLFTRDLPSWFRSAVSAVGRFWSGLYNSIRGPVARVIDTVLNGLISTFDWITSHIGLGSPIKPVHPFGLAAGGRIPGYGGGDRRPALLEDGETVVSKDDSRLPFMIAAFKAAGVPGYQAGGRIGQDPPPINLHTGTGAAGGPALGPLAGIIHKALDIGKITAALATGNSAALTNAFSDLLGHTGGATRLLGQILTQIPRMLVKDAVNWIMGAGGGASGNAIADYAMRFLGRIPYVWGGTAVPGGADCCLPGDQPVLTSTGPKPIIDIKAGDWVITWEENRPAVRRVTRRSAARRQMTYLVVTASTELEASGNHPFLTARPSGWEWTEVDDLRLGDLVVRYDQRTGDFREEAVVTVEPQAEKDTYDITVDGTHCFIAGGLVVHNSGFVQAIYEHFGIHAPRTSEAQGAWVRRSGPQPGGLAFYHSPPGGPDPGHVAIIRSASQVISQGGGLGPQLMNIRALPLLWTGIPPGGLGTGAGGAGTPGTMSAAAIAALWRQQGGPAWAAQNMARIAYAESGDRPGAIQQGQPPGLTGWGLYQITPTSGIRQGGVYGNLLNAANNTRAAISLFAQSGYAPWASDPVARGLLGAGARRGFARGGWINEPVTGIGAYSRALYDFSEGGRREAVIPEADLAAAGSGIGALAGRLDRIAKLLESGPNRTAAGIAAANAGPARVAAHAAWIGAR
jgi:hypothetical protein